MHGSLVREALALGVHVMCEKPFLLQPEDYDPVYDAAQQAGRCVMSAHNYRHSPAARELMLANRPEGIGTVLGGHFRTIRRGHARGVPEYAPDWRRDSSLSGGGILVDHGVHSVYLASAVLGREPQGVSCIAGNLASPRWADTEDTVLLRLDFAQGVGWDVDLTWGGARRVTRYRVWGSNGSLEIDGDKVTSSRNGTVLRSRVHSDFDDPRHPTWFRDVVAEFLRCIDDGVPARTTLSEAHMTSRVLAAAQRSMSEGGEYVSL